MQPLLKITNVPIAFELKINKARLAYRSGTVDLEISRDRGKMRISSSPIHLDIDSFQARNSISPASMSESIRKYAQQGRTAAYEATATFTQEGNLMLQAKLGEDVISDIIRNKTDKYFVPPDIGIQFIPEQPVDLNWSKPDMTIEYQMDKMNFDWKVMRGDFEFVPGDIEISITQQPDVIIEYIGKPVYVPPSADPEAEPEEKDSKSIDIKA